MPVMNEELRVGDLMTLDPLVVDPGATIAYVEDLLKRNRVTGLPVMRGGTLVGVISQSDLVVARSSSVIGANWTRLRVHHLMTAPAVSVHVGATIRLAAREMVSRHIHRLVVTDDDGIPVGVVTPLDLLRSLLDAPPSTS